MLFYYVTLSYLAPWFLCFNGCTLQHSVADYIQVRVSLMYICAVEKQYREC